jgi:Mn2+/Fe2+ NRAMP family transporter
MAREKVIKFLKTLGPGILFASTAIGVSHLVQSTRAGANFGFALIPLILLTNILKYPFFEFGSRYANITGESIIDGYRRMGKWMLWLYFFIVIGSMFFVSAAVGAVTSGFLQNLFGLTDYALITTIVLFIICAIILLLGRYSVLDSLVKVIGAVLLLSTLLAFTLALFKGPTQPINAVVAPDLFSDSSVLFIIALMGWMPTAVDLSAWNSLWTIERIKQTGYKPTLKETLADFNFGYIISGLLAVCFVTLGAYMLYGSGNELPNKSGDFAHTVVSMFTSFIGDWSYIIIATAAFSIMFGTAIAVFDGYGRSMARTMALMRVKDIDKEEVESRSNVYSIAIIVVVVGAFLIVFLLGKHLKLLVDLATTISFLIAPVIALVNYRLVTSKTFPSEGKPKLWLKVLSWLGIAFLTGFAFYYIWIILTTKG